MNEPITCVFSLKPIRSNLPLPHFKDPSGDRLQNLQDFKTSVSKAARKQTESFSSAICFKVGSVTRDRFLMSILFSLYLAALLSSTPLPVSFSLFVLSLHTFFSHPGFILCSGLKQKSLNHIRDGSLAFRHPLYPSSAAGVVSFLMFLSYFGFQSPLIPFVLHPSF